MPEWDVQAAGRKIRAQQARYEEFWTESHALTQSPLTPRASRTNRTHRYAKLLSLLKVSSLASYTATKLIEGVSVTIDEKKTRAEVQYLTVVPFFDVKETFVLDGMTRTKNKRRDLEKGVSTCTATLLNDSPDPAQGESYVLKLRMTWDEPNKGGLLEEMHVSTEGELVVTSTVQVRDGSATCRTVYEKVEGGRLDNQFRWNPLDAMRIMRGGTKELT